MKRKKKEKRKKVKREENWHKIKFLLQIFCAKDYFFLKMKNNWVLSEKNYLWNDRVCIKFFEKLFLFALKNHRTANSNMETSLNYIQNMTRFRRNCFYFRILNLRKLKIFILELFWIFTGICITFFPWIKNKYWLILHLFIIV